MKEERFITVNFNNKEYKARVAFDEEKDFDLTEVFNALNGIELFDYLYNNQKEMFDDINSDPYFEGRTINSGLDLKNAIEAINFIKYYKDSIYVCGEYWCDPEHGFSINFPNGKFVKKDSTLSGNSYTTLGLYADCL